MPPKLPPLLAVGLTLTFVSVVLHVISLATPCWVRVTFNFPRIGSVTVTFGLWVKCIKPGSCKTIPVDFLFRRDGGWLFVSRVFSFLGLLTGVAGLVLLLLSILVTRWRDSKLLTVLPMLLDFLAGGCILASALTFANNYQDTFTNMPRLDWSFALDCMAGLAACVAGLFMLLRRLGACP